jgi:hypothetical protein
MRLVAAVIVAALSGLAAGCGDPTDEQVKEAFLRENPSAVVIQVASGEGDGSTVYKHIRYRLAGMQNECEAVWGYQEAKPEWRVFHKGEHGLAGTLCEGCTRKACS